MLILWRLVGSSKSITVETSMLVRRSDFSIWIATDRSHLLSLPENDINVWKCHDAVGWWFTHFGCPKNTAMHYLGSWSPMSKIMRLLWRLITTKHPDSILRKSMPSKVRYISWVFVKAPSLAIGGPGEFENELRSRSSCSDSSTQSFEGIELAWTWFILFGSVSGVLCSNDGVTVSRGRVLWSIPIPLDPI